MTAQIGKIPHSVEFLIELSLHPYIANIDLSSHQWLSKVRHWYYFASGGSVNYVLSDLFVS